MSMAQTPVHERHNPDLLALLPAGATRLVEVGCSSGALAREYKKINPGCHYTGIEIDAGYAELAARHCDRVVHLDIEEAADDTMDALFPADCWIFGDALEHLRDPWGVLSRIRARMSPGACVVACIPNAQHWSVQVRLNTGLFFYEKAGLMDRTHLRWFTRATMIDLFKNAGFRVETGVPRVFNEPGREQVDAAIRLLAQSVGADPDQAVRDAAPLQYVFRAVADAGVGLVP